MPDLAEAARETQLPLLAVLLLLGAAAKAADRSGQGAASLLPARFRRALTLAGGAAEASLAAVLLVAAGWWGDAARVLTTLLFAAAVPVLLWVRRRDPEAGCGCFGGLSRAPVGWRTVVRAGVLAAAAASTVGVPVSGVQVLTGPTAAHGAVLAAQVVLLALLSPEPRELAARLRSREPCEFRRVPVRRTLARLRASGAWQDCAAVVGDAAPVDVWRQGCLRFLRFAGTHGDRPVDVVFAVPVADRRPAVRAAVTDSRTGAVLESFGAPPAREASRTPATAVPGPPR